MAPERFTHRRHRTQLRHLRPRLRALPMPHRRASPSPAPPSSRSRSGHMVDAAPQSHPRTRNTVPRGLDRVIETGLAKQTTDRYPTAVEMAAAARQAITEPTSRPPRRRADSTRAGSPQRSPSGWSGRVGSSAGYPPTPPPVSHATIAATAMRRPPPPPAPKRRGRRNGILIGAAVFIVTLIVVAGVVAVVELTGHDEPAATRTNHRGAGGVDFNGTYRADYGRHRSRRQDRSRVRLRRRANWAVRSTCGAGGCVATAANISEGGVALVSNLTFDQLGGTWVAVGLASALCGGDKPDEIWVVYTLKPQPDGTLSGETIRDSTNSACAAKRTVKFTRTGDADPNKVADPAVLPTRATSPADGLRGRYRETTTFTNGTVVPPRVLTAEHVLSSDRRSVHEPVPRTRWGRHVDVRRRQVDPQRAGHDELQRSGTAQITITAEYPMPTQIEDPIAVLTGSGNSSLRPAARAPAAATSRTSSSAPAIRGRALRRRSRP